MTDCCMRIGQWCITRQHIKQLFPILIHQSPNPGSQSLSLFYSWTLHWFFSPCDIMEVYPCSVAAHHIHWCIHVRSWYSLLLSCEIVCKLCKGYELWPWHVHVPIHGGVSCLHRWTSITVACAPVGTVRSSCCCVTVVMTLSTHTVSSRPCQMCPKGTGGALPVLNR